MLRVIDHQSYGWQWMYISGLECTLGLHRCRQCSKKASLGTVGCGSLTSALECKPWDVTWLKHAHLTWLLIVSACISSVHLFTTKGPCIWNWNWQVTLACQPLQHINNGCVYTFHLQLKKSGFLLCVILVFVHWHAHEMSTNTKRLWCQVQHVCLQGTLSITLMQHSIWG